VNALREKRAKREKDADLGTYRAFGAYRAGHTLRGFTPGKSRGEMHDFR